MNACDGETNEKDQSDENGALNKRHPRLRLRHQQQVA